jgi:transcriptional regulator with XRE-family HTH domain
MNELNKEIGERIAAARMYNKVTQQELAEVVGNVTGSSISQIENGRVNVSVRQLYDIALVLDCHPWTLLPWVSHDENPFK